MPQCQQVLMVTGADRLLFAMSDGTRENTFFVWVEPDTDWFDRIRAAWRLFNQDRENYKHVDLPPEAVRKVVPTLPSLVLDFEGAVTVKSNIAAFEAVVQARIDAVPAIFETDQEFDDAKADIKFLKEDVEDALEAALVQFLKKNEPIQTVIDAVRRLQEKSRNKRLPLANAVKNQAETINIKILTHYEDEFAAWLKAQNDSLSTKQALLPAMKPDFALAIKGKRLISSRHDACKQVMANAKLSIGDSYTRIQTNMAMMREQAGSHGFLFQDAKAIVNMDPVAAEAVVKQRIAEYEAAEQKKRDDAAVAQRARAEAEERQRLADIERRDVEAQQALQAVAPPAPPQVQPEPEKVAPATFQTPAQDGSYTVERADPVGNTSPPTMNLGKISAVLGFTVTAAFLQQIGCHPAKTERASFLYHDRDILTILEALGAHLQAVYSAQKAKYQPARTRTAA